MDNYVYHNKKSRVKLLVFCFINGITLTFVAGKRPEYLLVLLINLHSSQFILKLFIRDIDKN